MPKVPDEILLQRANEVHKGRYAYGPVRKVDGIKGNVFTVICCTHGEFLQPVSRHLSGKGCKKCAMEALVSKQRHTLDSVREAVADFGFDYTYTELVYYNGTKAPDIVYDCPTHGTIRQNLYNHLQGKGCAACSVESRRIHALEAAAKQCRK